MYSITWEVPFVPLETSLDGFQNKISAPDGKLNLSTFLYIKLEMLTLTGSYLFIQTDLVAEKYSWCRLFCLLCQPLVHF